MGRGGGQVVSVLAFSSDDPSSNPAEGKNFRQFLNHVMLSVNKKHPNMPVNDGFIML